MSDALIQRLDSWLVSNRTQYHAQLLPGASRARLDEFAKRLGLDLPLEFRDLYMWRNGQAQSCFENFQGNWMFSSLADIDESKEIFDELIGTDFKDPKYWRRTWVPFLSNGGGSHLCIDMLAEDGGNPGQLIEFWKGTADRPVRHPSLSAWLSNLVGSMENGSFEAN
jgi:cell wall assembly regulator SMI1